MTKYRGSADELRRGPYRAVTFTHDFSDEEYYGNWNRDKVPYEESPFRDIDAYLRRVGIPADRYAIHYADGVDQFGGSYHLAGSTVVVKYKHYSQERTSAAGVGVQVISNETCDDVADKLKKRFPYLSDGEEEWDRIQALLVY